MTGLVVVLDSQGHILMTVPAAEIKRAQAHARQVAFEAGIETIVVTVPVTQVTRRS